VHGRKVGTSKHLSSPALTSSRAHQHDRRLSQRTAVQDQPIVGKHSTACTGPSETFHCPRPTTTALFDEKAASSLQGTTHHFAMSIQNHLERFAKIAPEKSKWIREVIFANMSASHRYTRDPSLLVSTFTSVPRSLSVYHCERPHLRSRIGPVTPLNLHLYAISTHHPSEHKGAHDCPAIVKRACTVCGDLSWRDVWASAAGRVDGIARVGKPSGEGHR